MKRKIFTVKVATICLMCLVILLGGVSIVPAKDLQLTWDASNSTGVEGYKVYYGPESGNYTTSVDVGNVTETQVGLQEGQEYYLACTAYRDNAESAYSNEINYYISGETTSQNDYQASAEFDIRDYGTIKGNVDSLPSDPKSVYWQKSGLSLKKGEEVELDMEAYCINGEKTPISVYIKDAETGEWITRERVAYIDYNLTGKVKLTVKQDCSNATLKVVCGHRTGQYEFSEIEIESYTGPVTPLREFYLYRLVTPVVQGKYAVQWKWNEIPEADEFIIRVAQDRKAIENPVYHSLFKTVHLGPDETEFTLDIENDLFNGLFISVTPVINGQEETPMIYPYLPGNVKGTADDAEPPLYTQISVDRDDYYNAYYGYLYNWTVDAPDGPADMRERMDIDNNGLAGRYDDFYFIKSQYGKSLE